MDEEASRQTTDEVPPEMQKQKTTFDIEVHVVDAWRKVGSDKRLLDDTQIASFLIGHYVSCQHRDQDTERCIQCNMPLTLFCFHCQLLPQKEAGNSVSFLKYLQPPLVTKSAMEVTEHQEIAHKHKKLLSRYTASEMQDPSLVIKTEPDGNQSDSIGEPSFRVQDPGQNYGPTAFDEVGRQSGDDLDNDIPVQFSPLVHAAAGTVSSTRGRKRKGVKASKRNSITKLRKKNKVLMETTSAGRDSADEITASSKLVKQRRTRSGRYGLRTKSAKSYACSDSDSESDLLGVVNTFACKICDERLPSFADLKEHTQSHEGADSYLCTDCQVSFPSALLLEEHLQKHTSDEPFVCSVCNSVFKTNQSLNNHMRTHSGEKPYKCKHCGKMFARSGYLKEHVRTHTGEKPYVCNQCDASFAQWSSLKRHKDTHSVSKPHVCPLCGKAYKRAWSLMEHTITHHSETGEDKDDDNHDEAGSMASENTKPADATGETESANENNEKLAQNVAGLKTTYTSRGAEKYRSRLLQRKLKPFMCEQCGKRLSSSACLRIHMRLHRTVQPFTCKECGKGFVFRHSLIDHMRGHRGEKPYVCTTCGRAFLRSHTLAKHVLIHTGEKPHPCKYPGCNSSFRTSYQQKAHMRTHTKSKPFVCQVCNTGFSQTCSLKKHMRKHTDERPYVCQTCGHGFRRSDHLKKHILVHTGEKPCMCEVCGAAFRKSDTLKSHMRKVHDAAASSRKRGGENELATQPFLASAVLPLQEDQLKLSFNPHVHEVTGTVNSTGNCMSKVVNAHAQTYDTYITIPFS